MTTAARSPIHEGIPPLENGDRLSRPEFERRYEATPEDFKAELIEGVVYVASPARADQHGDPAYNIIGWLNAYSVSRPNVRGSDNSTVRLDLDNEPQPDICLRYAEGGQTRLIDGYIEGAPELVVEISASSASIDLHLKKNAYRRNGVQEYIVWRTRDEAIDWFALENGEYVALSPDANGIIRSRVFPGLRLATQAMIDGDMARVIATQSTSA